MGLNDENKEKYSTEINETNEFSESSENAEEKENLIKIIGGEVDYSDEKVSLKDALKSAFNIDDETSEDKVVEDADDEVVFVAPERILDFVDDYLDHAGDDEDLSESSESESDLEVYFSTGNTYNEDEIPDGNMSTKVQEDIFADEGSVEAEEEIAEPSNEESIEAEEEIAELSDEESVEAEEEIAEPSDEESVEAEEEIAEPSDEKSVEAEEEIAEPSDEESVEAEKEIAEQSDEESVEAEEEIAEPSDEESVEAEKEIAEPSNEESVEAEEEIAEPSDEESVEAEEDFWNDADIPVLLGGKKEPEEYTPLADEISDEELNIYESDEAEENVINVRRHRDKSENGEALYESEASENNSFFKRHSIVNWAKNKTTGGWVKFGLKCVGVLALVLCVSAVLYVNGLLDLINYKDADDFEQYYNLSDTDYVVGDEEVYSTPVYYNSSTTIEGFNESMIDIPKEDVVNILLIGTDVRSGTYNDRGNTDSMILMSINTRDKNIKLTSFMRDMYVSIPGRGKNRINAAYAYGGPQLLFDTLKENFNVDVNLYARVNFNNFRNIIDQVGGVKIELTEAEARYMNKYAYKYNTDPVQSGLQRLDGAQALSYARCRKIDSDFNRTQRQRKVILAFIDEIKSSNVTELNSLLNTLLPMIQTNVPKMQIIGLLTDSFNYLNNDVETLNIPIKNSWQSATINKMSVLCPNFKLNQTAIVAHIYSTYKLNVEDTVFKSFDIPADDSAKSTTRTTTKKNTYAASSATAAVSTAKSTPPTSSPTTEKPVDTDKTTSSKQTDSTAKSSETTIGTKNNQFEEDIM